MANMGKYKPKNAYEYKNTYYDEKSSDHGHYEPEVTGKRYGRDGSMARVTQMRWVEDNRDFSPEASAPTPETAPPEPTSPDVSPEIEYSPEIQNAQQLVNRFEQGSTPYNDLSSQAFLDSYKKGFDTRNSTDVESVGANLNFDLPNNVETTDNNMFANNTFNPVDKSDEAAQNFLSDKKKLILG
jgi:hypothetical protein